MTAKQRYQKEYSSRPEVKKVNAERMKEVYATEDGQKKEHDKRRTARSRYSHGACNARRRGKVFTLTFEEYQVLVASLCKYCNNSIADETGLSLDRIEDGRGYETGNVNPCCKKCNRIRAKSMSAEEFERQTKLNQRWKE